MVPEAAAARLEAQRLNEQLGFWGADDRARSARIFVNRVVPAALVLVTVLTLFEQLAGDLAPELWVACAGLWAIQLVFSWLLRRGVDPTSVAGATLVSFGLLEAVAMPASPNPVGASATYVFLVVVTAYFLPAWPTLLYTFAATALITVSARTIDHWGQDYLLPSTAFMTLLTGCIATFIMSRARETERRLEKLAAEQRAALERLEQVDRARDRLIANVSHELRTPLTSTIGSIETLLRDDVQLDDESRRRLMHVARDGGLRLLALVEDLLTLGATRPDSLELAATPERLADLARDAIVGIDPGDDRTVVLDLDEELFVRVDRLRLLQVVGNLVVNAIRHGHGDVVVQARREGRDAVLRVLDDGPGVDPQHVGELFLPFARFSTRPDSTGLGLAICRTIVEAHGGTIEYDRVGEPPRTSFTVTLAALGRGPATEA